MEFICIFRLIQFLILVLPGYNLSGVDAETIWNAKVFTQSNCTLTPERKRHKLLLENLIEQDNRLITLEVNLHWTLQPENSSYLQKASWYMTTDSTGRRLLLLDDHYASMSLQTLSYGTANVQISFIQEPADCLANFTADDIEKSLMFSLLTLPKDSKSMNDDDISILHICTGSVNSDGSCCNLTLNGEYITCDNLYDDSMLSALGWIISIMTFVALSHCPLLIPKSFYKTGSDNNRNSYRVLNTSLGLKIRAVSEDSNENDEHKQGIITQEIHGIFDAIAEDINGEQFAFSNARQSEGNNCYYKDSLREGLCLDSITMEDSALVSELEYSKGLFYNVQKTLSDIFCRCLIKDNAYFRRFCYGKPFSDCSKCTEMGRNLFCYQCLQILFIVVAFFLLCLFPVILRAILLQMDPVYVFLNFIPLITLIIFSVACVLIIRNRNIEQETITNVEDIIGEVLENRLEKKAYKLFSLLLPPCTCRTLKYNFSGKSYFWMILTFPISLAYFCYLSLPLLNLFYDIYIIGWKKMSIRMRSLFPFFAGYIYALLLFMTYYILFYVTCITYIFLGLFLNYDQIIDEVILVLLVVSYGLNCVNEVYNKINKFNQYMFTLVEESYNDIITEMFNHAQTRKENIAFRIYSSDERVKSNCVGLYNGNEKKNISNPVTGLYLFYKYKMSENMAYLHIPETFLDSMSSKCTSLTPGSKFVLFYKACREIFFLIVLVVVAYYVVDGFSRANNTSTTMHTLVTVGTSTLLALVNKIIFRKRQTKAKDHEIPLKSLLEQQIQEYQYLWMEAEIGLNLNEDRVGNNKVKIHSSSEVVAVVSDCENENKPRVTEFQLRSCDETEPFIQKQNRNGYEVI